MSYKRICFDFDGVIHSYKSGWKGEAIIPDPPIEGIDEVLYDLVYGQQYEVVIQSTRCSTPEGKTAIWKWLEKYNLDQFVSALWDTKPPAVVYIDDRGLHFDGNCEGLSNKIIKIVETGKWEVER